MPGSPQLFQGPRDRVKHIQVDKIHGQTLILPCLQISPWLASGIDDLPPAESTRLRRSHLWACVVNSFDNPANAGRTNRKKGFLSIDCKYCTICRRKVAWSMGASADHAKAMNWQFPSASVSKRSKFMGRSRSASLARLACMASKRSCDSAMLSWMAKRNCCFSQFSCKSQYLQAASLWNIYMYI